MHSLLKGSITTLLVVVPLVAVPLAAFFGLPRFAPMAGSQDEESETDSDSEYVETGLGESTHYSPDDLFAPLEDGNTLPSTEVVSTEAPANWNDPFRDGSNNSGPENTQNKSNPAPPDGALGDWAIDRAQIRSQSPPSNRSDETDEDSKVPGSWAGAVARLKELGIERYRLEPGEAEGQFYFCCFFTPADNPRVTRRFESEAADPLIAVGEVIEQVERWKSPASLSHSDSRPNRP